MDLGYAAAAGRQPAVSFAVALQSSTDLIFLRLLPAVNHLSTLQWRYGAVWIWGTHEPHSICQGVSEEYIRPIRLHRTGQL